MKDFDTAVEIIAGASGVAGPNYEYAISQYWFLGAANPQDSACSRSARGKVRR
jgi:hypothetical protein